MTAKLEAKDVIRFWFEETNSAFWFKKEPDFDAEIGQRFGSLVARALNGQLDHWASNADGCLALIIALDQFTRNIFRDTPRAFSGDEMALALSLRCVQLSYLDQAVKAHRHFMLMPMMHSEELTIQNNSLPLFEKYTGSKVLEYAVKHRDIIAKFGRFPHRNRILGRPSSSEEIIFLSEPGSSF